MIQHSLIEQLMDRLRPGWRARKERRKSPWHLLKVVLMVGLLFGLWFVFFRLMWELHLLFHPEHRLDEFLQGDVTGFPLFASLLLAAPLAIPAFGIAAIMTNLVFWCIAPARRAFEREAIGEPEADEEPDPEMTFHTATMSLLRITVIYLLPIGLGLSLLGAHLLTALR